MPVQRLFIISLISRSYLVLDSIDLQKNINIKKDKTSSLDKPCHLSSKRDQVDTEKCGIASIKIQPEHTAILRMFEQKLKHTSVGVYIACMIYTYRHYFCHSDLDIAFTHNFHQSEMESVLFSMRIENDENLFKQIEYIVKSLQNTKAVVANNKTANTPLDKTKTSGIDLLVGYLCADVCDIDTSDMLSSTQHRLAEQYENIMLIEEGTDIDQIFFVLSSENQFSSNEFQAQFLHTLDVFCNQLHASNTHSIHILNVDNEPNLHVKSIFDSYSEEYDFEEMFEEKLYSIPDSIALRYKGNNISYEYLNLCAENLKEKIHLYCDRYQDHVVAIIAENSIEKIIGMLATVKAGCAYLPVDPSWPAQRVDYILKDCSVDLILYQSEAIDIGSNLQKMKCVDISQSVGMNLCVSDTSESKPRARHKCDLAYINYTSGSTGKPKGVQIERRSIARLIKPQKYFSVTPDDIMLHAAPFTFDACTLEVWGSLCNGCTLIIYPDKALDLNILSQVFVHEKITTAWLTARLFETFSSSYNMTYPNLKNMIFGGDVVSTTNINNFRANNPHVRMINGYGPTETTTFATTYVIEPEELVPRDSLPIGFPIAQTQVYIFDENHALVSPGVEGEIYIGGSGVARGYVGENELTIKSFMNVFIHGVWIDRVYKTGDIGRYRPDGGIEFVGRSDNQIKLNGIRVELGEIENVIERIDLVEKCSVITDKHERFQSIYAFFTIHKNNHEMLKKHNFHTLNDDFDALKILAEKHVLDHIKKEFPAYMMPKKIICLSAMPVNDNGKIDKNSLIANSKQYDSKEKNINYRNPIDKKISDICCKVFEVDTVNMNDSFFALDGNSLQAMEFIANLSCDIDIHIPINMFFESSSLFDFSDFVLDLIEKNKNENKVLSEVDKKTQDNTVEEYI